MTAADVTETLNLALQAADLDQANVVHRPRLLSDNGSSYISGDLAKWLKGRGMQHSRHSPLFRSKSRPDFQMDGANLVVLNELQHVLTARTAHRAIAVRND